MKKRTYVLLVLLLFSLLFWSTPSYLDQSEAFQNLLVGTRDLFFKIRHASSGLPEVMDEIVIVTIDDESCEKLGLRWPWPRGVLAAMIDELHKREARLVGLNVAFTGLEAGGEASTQELSDAIRRHGNTVIGASFDKENRLIRPNALIADSAKAYGYLEKIVDDDFAIRRSYLLRPYLSSEDFESSFPLALVAAYGREEIRGSLYFDRGRAQLTVKSPPRQIALSDDGSYTLNYLAAESDFTRIPAWRVAQGKLSVDDVRGKVVLVGLASSLFSDLHPTPLGMMSGIGIHANEFLSIFSSRLLDFFPDKAVFLLSWVLSLGVMLLFLTRPFWFGLLGFSACVFALFVGAQMAFAKDLVLEPFILLMGPFLSLVVGAAANGMWLLFEKKGLESKVIQDKLTGLYTYDYLRLRLEDEWKRSKKSKQPLSLVMTDLDRFKQINDSLGHEVGNLMIQRAGNVIKELARGLDVVSRYGGDEFVVLLWNTNKEQARAYRGRLRELYHAMAQKLEPALRDSSISIGIATFDPAADPARPSNPQSLIEEADGDLLRDKESRRKGPPRA